MVDGKVIIEVKSNAKSVAKDFNTLDKSLNRTEKELKDVDKQADKTKRALGGLKSAIGIFASALAGVQLINFGKNAVKTGFQITALNNKFKAAAGSAEDGAASFEFVKDVTDELGLSFIETASAYAGFTAAATRSGLTFKETEQIFKDVASAATSLQLPADRVGLVFRALEQISSKGVVSLEELKLQLGDSLPGAVQIAAKSMDLTTKAFLKAVSSGEILSKDFLPAFAKQIREELGGSAEDAANSLQAAFIRVGNSFAKLQSELTREGSVINTALKFLSIGVGEINTQLALLVGTSDSIKLERARREFNDTQEALQELTLEAAETRKAFDENFFRSFDKRKFESTEAFVKLNEEAERLIAKRDELAKTLEVLTPEIRDEEIIPPIEQNTIETFKTLTEEAKNLQVQLLNLSIQGQAGTEQFNELGLKLEDVSGILKEAKDNVKTFSDSAEEDLIDLEDVADDLGGGLSRALTEPLREGENAFQRFGNVALSVIQNVAQGLISSGISGALTGGAGGGGGLLASIGGLFGGATASAKGNVFNSGNVQAFADGGAFTNGIVSKPTLFPMANGGTGLMGEAGAEAIMPLRRDGSGRLGIDAQGMAGSTVNIINNAQVQIEEIKRPNNETDVIINQVNTALASSRTKSSFGLASQQQQNSGVQAS